MTADKINFDSKPVVPSFEPVRPPTDEGAPLPDGSERVTVPGADAATAAAARRRTAGADRAEHSPAAAAVSGAPPRDAGASASGTAPYAARADDGRAARADEKAEGSSDGAAGRDRSAPKVDKKRFLEKARRFAGKLPFVRHAVAMWFAVVDKETPWHVKATIIAALAYFVLPTDLIPDFLPGLIGFGDDAAVVMGTLRLVQSHIKDVHYERADRALRRDTGLADGDVVDVTAEPAS